MKKLLLATAVAAAAGAPATPLLAQDSPHSVTANVGFFSEYIFRGISQTGGEPALQGGFDYAHSSGFYAGTWASNISWLQDFNCGTAPCYKRSSLEWDFYGGFKRNIGNSDFYFDVGTIYYYYPGNRNPGVFKADTWEIYGGLGWKFVGFKYSYSLTDYFGARNFTGTAGNQKTDGTWYLDIFASYAFGDSGFSVSGHYGILDVNNDGTGAGEASYKDWRIGAAYTVPSGVLKGLEAGLYYTDTDVKKTGGTSYYVDGTNFDTAQDTIVLYVKKTF